MKQAVREDKDKVVKIIIESFDSNPHVNFVIKNDRKRHKRIVEMARYAFEFGMPILVLHPFRRNQVKSKFSN